ncbi:MAG: hypothetical protein AABY64_09840 [Bdellovibrionota bacterium]
MFDSPLYGKELFAASPNNSNILWDAPGMSVAMSIPVKVLSTLNDYGILSLFEAGGSLRHPSIEPEDRLATDRVIGRLPMLDWFPPSLHPHSGYLVEGEIKKYDKFRGQYGTAILVFKKERILNRTTTTSGDSAPGLQGTPLIRKNGAHDYGDYYVEAQIWGRVTLEDVGAIYISEGEFLTQKSTLLELQQMYDFDIFTMKVVPREGYKGADLLEDVKLVSKGNKKIAPKNKHKTDTELISRFQQLSEEIETLKKEEHSWMVQIKPAHIAGDLAAMKYYSQERERVEWNELNPRVLERNSLLLIMSDRSSLMLDQFIQNEWKITREQIKRSPRHFDTRFHNYLSKIANRREIELAFLHEVSKHTRAERLQHYSLQQLSKHTELTLLEQRRLTKLKSHTKTQEILLGRCQSLFRQTEP